MSLVQSNESYENLLLCKHVETSVFDYYINMKDIAYKNTLLCYNQVTIYEAEWRYERVCVKEIDTDNNISNELLVLSKCIHPKIVQFLGFHRGSIRTSILFEYMENGNLQEYIKQTVLTNQHKLNIMLDVAKALHYLHNRYPEIVLHRDMKPSNILINNHGEAKLSDFGISKMVKKKHSYDYNSHSSEKGTYIWMSPEVLSGDHYNCSTDVYSFGLIMYYIWTGILPFNELQLSMVQLMFKKNQGVLQLANIDDFNELNELIRQCVLYQSTDRPNTQTIITKLLHIMDQL